MALGRLRGSDGGCEQEVVLQRSPRVTRDCTRNSLSAGPSAQRNQLATQWDSRRLHPPRRSIATRADEASKVFNVTKRPSVTGSQALRYDPR
jgi:hypothetical protein